MEFHPVRWARCHLARCWKPQTEQPSAFHSAPQSPLRQVRRHPTAALRSCPRSLQLHSLHPHRHLPRNRMRSQFLHCPRCCRPASLCQNRRPPRPTPRMRYSFAQSQPVETWCLRLWDEVRIGRISRPSTCGKLSVDSGWHRGKGAPLPVVPRSRLPAKRSRVSDDIDQWRWSQRDRHVPPTCGCAATEWRAIAIGWPSSVKRRLIGTWSTSSRIALDERRDRKLTRLGYQVLHLDAALVMQQPSVAVERIRKAIAVAQSR
jgi:hypothetical protein